MSDTRLPRRSVEIRTRTKIIERTELLTDGETWQVKCSCGFKTPLYRREKTARRHLNEHAPRSR